MNKILKAKLKANNKKVKGYIELSTKGYILFKDINSNILLKVPAYRIVQTGYRKKFYFFCKKIYFKTNDGLPKVFYTSRPKKIIRVIDNFTNSWKNRPPLL